MENSDINERVNAAPKYVLKVEGLELYLAEKQRLSGVNLTDDIKKARKYAIGFDEIEVKLKTWNIAAYFQFNNKDVKFEVVYL